MCLWRSCCKGLTDEETSSGWRPKLKRKKGGTRIAQQVRVLCHHTWWPKFDPQVTYRRKGLSKLCLTVGAQSKDAVTWREFGVLMRKQDQSLVSSVSLKTWNCSWNMFRTQARCGQEWVTQIIRYNWLLCSVHVICMCRKTCFGHVLLALLILYSSTS